MWGLTSLFVLPQLVHKMPEMWGPTGHSLAAVQAKQQVPSSYIRHHLPSPTARLVALSYLVLEHVTPGSNSCLLADTCGHSNHFSQCRLALTHIQQSPIHEPTCTR